MSTFKMHTFQNFQNEIIFFYSKEETSSSSRLRMELLQEKTRTYQREQIPTERTRLSAVRSPLWSRLPFAMNSHRKLLGQR